MQRVISLVLLLCCIFSLYSWIFDDSVVVVGAGPKFAEDEYGNSIDENGFVVPEYNDEKFSGAFYDAAAEPLAFINSVANAFDVLLDGIVDFINMATSATQALSEAFTELSNTIKDRLGDNEK